MIVVAVIGILAAIAVPNFIAYRDKTRIAGCIGSSESIKGALAGYASSETNNLFPATIDYCTTLRTIANANGATLKEIITDQGYSAMTYSAVLDSQNQPASYVITFRCNGIPADLTGSIIEVKPSGIERFTT